MTGASGTLYGRRLLQVLLSRGHTVHFVVSDAARRVLAAEEDIHVGAIPEADELLAGLGPLLDTGGGSGRAGRATAHAAADITSKVASGSFRIDAMAVVPCSMATMGTVATGTGRNLIHRAADVTIKEGRRLVLAPRETPLSVLHLEQMARLAGMGVRMVACMPGFYHRPSSVMDLVDFVVDRILTQMGLEGGMISGWRGRAADGGS